MQPHMPLDPLCPCSFCLIRDVRLEEFEIKMIVDRRNGQNMDRMIVRNVQIVTNLSSNCEKSVSFERDEGRRGGVCKMSPLSVL